MADLLYVGGTLLQLVAFSMGMRPAVLGLSLMVYGAGLTLYASRW